MSEHILKDLPCIRLLDEAERLLNKYGWLQGESIRRDVSGHIIGYCMSGAIGAAAVNLDALEEDMTAVNGRLNKMAGSIHDYVAWNDRKGRTFDEVIAFIREARESFVSTLT